MEEVQSAWASARGGFVVGDADVAALVPGGRARVHPCQVPRGDKRVTNQ